ncbi:MAG: hypothetical protein IIA87_00620 [Nanoarchaeota archaeon]|nr:hypothetical protein [Nanoarchaeota archaeon]
MLSYNDLFEYLRKEKYSEQLQPVPKNIITQFSEYLKEKKKQFSSSESDIFTDDMLREKKQFENAIVIFKELMLRRKKKILNLVFVAAETGIMKRDFTDMLSFEQELFEKLVKSVEEGENKMNELLNGKMLKSENKFIIMKESVENFVGMSGEIIGPFNKGELVNIDFKIADILVSGKKAMFVDEE